MPDHHLSEDSVLRSAEAFLWVGDKPSRWICGCEEFAVPSKYPQAVGKCRCRYGHMDYAECLARRLFEHVLTGSRMNYRLSQSRGEYDFDLVYSNSGNAAVEVTTTIDSALQETWRQILNKRKGGGVIPAKHCKKSWSITISSGTRVDPIRRKADEYLAAIEHAGISSFQGSTDSRQQVRDIRQDLGVVYGSALPEWLAPPRILIGLPGPTEKLTNSAAIDAAEHEATKPDNRAKLGGYEGGERYLAVYAPPHSFASFGLWMYEPPPKRANLPGEISQIWIFGDDFGRKDDVVVWRAGPETTWQKAMYQV